MAWFHQEKDDDAQPKQDREQDTCDEETKPVSVYEARTVAYSTYPDLPDANGWTKWYIHSEEKVYH